MAFAAPRSFKERARSLAAGLGVRRPLHVAMYTRGLVFGVSCTYHTLTNPELTNQSPPAPQAKKKKRGPGGTVPPRF